MWTRCAGAAPAALPKQLAAAGWGSGGGAGCCEVALPSHAGPRRGCGGSSNAVDTLGPRRLSATTPIHKDPSLAAMLLGEVAEVC